MVNMIALVFYALGTNTYFRTFILFIILCFVSGFYFPEFCINPYFDISYTVLRYIASIEAQPSVETASKKSKQFLLR